MRIMLASLALVLFSGVAATTSGNAVAAQHASCAGAVSWSKAKAHVGRVKTVRGRVAGTRYASSSNGAPTFLNVGADYPSPKRFTVVVWGRDRHRFGAPERRYARRTICVRGLIESYNGVAEIHARSPSQITIG